MKFEYPMMVITQKKSIMQRRLRRIRKMKAADASSDDSDEESADFENSLTQTGILKHLEGKWYTESDFGEYEK